ncbi:peptidase, partial [Actinomyces naeslundii]|uniref:peptidase n=2 Tax=Actinomyces naeslundii TaxID=1655 RepID=UPI00096CA775
MRLGRPLAAASAVAAMTGASLIASPALANNSNRNSPSSPSATSSPSAPSSPSATSSPSPSESAPSPSDSPKASPSPSGSSETTSSSSFKITQEKTFVSASTNTSFTVSGSGCTGDQATVGIALYAPDGSVSDVVKTEAAADGNWSADLDLEALIKSIGTSAATTTEGWKIGAGCTTNGSKTEMTQVTTQQQTQIYFDDTRITGSYEVSARTEGQGQTFTFNAQGFYASETVTVVLKSKSDSSITYTLGELTVDANGNLQGNLPAPTDAANGEYLLVLTGSHHSETATSQTVTRVSEHTFTIETSESTTTERGTTESQTTENNGGGGTSEKTERERTENKAGGNNGGGDNQKNGGSSETSESQKSEKSETSTSESQKSETSTSESQSTERSASENNAGNNGNGGNNQAGGKDNKAAAEQQANGANNQAGGKDNKAAAEQQANGANNQAGGKDNKAAAEQQANGANNQAGGKDNKA